MPFELFNTLSGTTIEPLSASDGATLRMYCCGPTVYDYGHIGNFRTFLHVDVLRRVIKLHGIGVKHVMNITDVDDKIIRNAGAAGQPIRSTRKSSPRLSSKTLTRSAWSGPRLSPRPPTISTAWSRSSSSSQRRTSPIRLKTAAGTSASRAFPEYGKLSKKDFEGIEDGARVDVDEYDKDAARDFALWKAAKPGETSWDTTLGAGRPGWHIECSAMAMKYLGDSFDLHAGGEDLMFPHHENEIAQSESATHVTFARHWFHVRFLLVEGKKMSKSEGNFYTLRDLLLKGHRASAIRFLLLSVPYRHQLNFTFDGLTESTNAVERLRTFHARIRDGKWDAAVADSTLADIIRMGDQKFTAALANDLNTAEARAAIFDVLRAVNTSADKATLGSSDAALTLTLLAKFDSVFAILEDRDAELTRAALTWAEAENRLDQADASVVATLSFSDADIDALVAERTQAKKQRNFARADAIRNELLDKGILLEDSKDGVRWKRK